VSKHKYKEGQQIIVKKPKNVRTHPTWTGEMNSFDGTVQKIRECVLGQEDVIYLLEGAEWYFCESWLTFSTELGKAIYL